MGLPRKYAFAYQHKASAIGNLDMGKFVEKIRCKVVVIIPQGTFSIVQT